MHAASLYNPWLSLAPYRNPAAVRKIEERLDRFEPALVLRETLPTGPFEYFSKTMRIADQEQNLCRRYL